MSEHVAVEITETRGVDAGNTFLWCSDCAAVLRTLPDGTTVVDDDEAQTGMPTNWLTVSDVAVGQRCEAPECGYIWMGRSWESHNEMIEDLENKASAVRVAKVALNTTIQRAVQAGISLREVATATGVSHEQVRRICGASSSRLPSASQ